MLTIAEENYQSLESLFADTYPDMYTDEYDGAVTRLLYFDLDTNRFDCKDDEEGSYRRAFEQQNNVIVICRVSANTAIASHIEAEIESQIQMRL